jgi:hypothetical protein
LKSDIVKHSSGCNTIIFSYYNYIIAKNAPFVKSLKAKTQLYTLIVLAIAYVSSALLSQSPAASRSIGTNTVHDLAVAATALCVERAGHARCIKHPRDLHRRPLRNTVPLGAPAIVGADLQPAPLLRIKEDDHGTAAPLAVPGWGFPRAPSPISEPAVSEQRRDIERLHAPVPFNRHSHGLPGVSARPTGSAT